MKKLFLITSAVVLARVGCTLFFGQSNSENVETAKSHNHDTHQASPGVVDYPSIPTELSTGVDMFIADSPSENANTDNETSEKDTIVWQLSEEGEKVLKAEGKIPGDVENEAYVELDIAELKSVEVGDYIDLYIPQIGGSYTGEVDYITQHPNGDRTVEAYIPGAGSLYSAVITLGENAVYGTLGTQADVYIMEGNGRYAWMAAKADLVSNHSPDHADGVMPEGDVVLNEGSDDVFDIGAKESPNQ